MPMMTMRLMTIVGREEDRWKRRAMNEALVREEEAGGGVRRRDGRR
jgi:hypothetical protein